MRRFFRLSSFVSRVVRAGARKLPLVVGATLLSTGVVACHAIANVTPQEVKALAAKLSSASTEENAVDTFKELIFTQPGAVLPAIPTIVSMAHPTRNEADRRAALDVLNDAIADVQNAESAVKSGLISHLVSIIAMKDLDRSDSILLDFAVTILNKLATIASVNKRIANEAAVHLATVASDKSLKSELRSSALSALSHLLKNESYHSTLVKNIPQLFSLLSENVNESNLTAQSSAALAIALLMNGPLGAKVPADLSKTVIELPLFTEGENEIAVTRVVASLFGNPKTAANPWAKSAILTLGTLLMPLKQRNEAVYLEALKGLADASHNARLQEFLAASPVIDQVMLRIASPQAEQSILAMKIVQHVVSRSESAASHAVHARCTTYISAAAHAHKKNPVIRERISEVLLALSRHAPIDDRPLILQSALPLFLGLLRLNDIETQRNAMCGLAHLSVNGLSKFMFAREGALSDLVAFLKKKDIELLRQTTKAVANLASTENAMYGENALELRKLNALKPLCELILSPDAVVHRNATWAIAAMTAYSLNHEWMAPTVDYLLKVLQGGTLEGKKYAVMALSNIAATPKTRDYLNQRQCVRAIYSCAQAHTSDNMLQSLAMQAVANLVRNGTVVFAIPPPELND